MIGAKDILAAAQRHRLDVSTDHAEQAAALALGFVEPPGVLRQTRRATTPSLSPDIAFAIDRTPIGAGKLTGLSVAIKDNISVAQAPTALGSGLVGFIPERDATVVARLHAAGARLTAKAQCEAFLLGANSFTSRPSPVPNPRDPRRSAGGSSSGSASLVARGACDVAIGTDSGGSIRIPAAYCGVVGFKPTRGAVSYTGISPLEPFLETVGPIARTVADAALLFSVIEGADGLDCRAGWRVTPATPQLETRGRPRFAVLDSAFAMLAQPARDRFDKALSCISAEGATLERIETDFLERAAAAHLAIYTIGQAATLLHDQRASALATSLPDDWQSWWHGLDRAALPRELSLLLALGAAWAEIDPSAYGRACIAAAALGAELDTLLSEFDALLLPTVADIAPLIPHGAPDMDAVFGDTRLTAPFNLTGHPAISLPAGDIDGAPLGLQLVAMRGDDQALLRQAKFIERSLAAAHSADLRAYDIGGRNS